MTRHTPPVPPANRPKTDPAADAPPGEKGRAENRPTPGNTAKQGRQGNIKQNTKHQGYQQDR